MLDIQIDLCQTRHVEVSGPSTIATLQDDNARLVAENNILRTDIGYWKNRHEKAVEREAFLKKELQDKNARIKYLTRQLYEKKTEQSRKSSESTCNQDDPKKRKRGQQPDYPHPKRRDQSHLPTTVEDYDLQESEQYCSSCGLPFKVMPDTEDSEVLETKGSQWIPENHPTEKVYTRMFMPRQQRDYHGPRPP